MAHRTFPMAEMRRFIDMWLHFTPIHDGCRIHPVTEDPRLSNINTYLELSILPRTVAIWGSHRILTLSGLEL